MRWETILVFEGEPRDDFPTLTDSLRLADIAFGITDESSSLSEITSSLNTALVVSLVELIQKRATFFRNEHSLYLNSEVTQNSRSETENAFSVSVTRVHRQGFVVTWLNNTIETIQEHLRGEE